MLRKRNNAVTSIWRRTHAARLFVLVVHVVCLTFAFDVAGAQAHSGEPGSRVAESEADSSGRALYLKLYCGLCHASERAGTAGIFGPSHDGMKGLAVSRLEDPNYKGAASSPEAYIRESILDPMKYLAPGYETSVHRMPSYKHLSAEEVQALVTFLMGEST